MGKNFTKNAISFDGCNLASMANNDSATPDKPMQEPCGFHRTKNALENIPAVMQNIPNDI
jgi:hypothetical protein